MNPVLPDFVLPRPRWQHIVRFIALAAALHGLLLMLPLREAPPVQTARPLSADLRQGSNPAVAPAPAAPRSAPERSPAAAARPQILTRNTPAIADAPVVAQAVSTTATPDAPSAPALTSTTANAASDSAPRSAAALTPARFDAAYLRNPAPAYPAMSRRLGEEGKVMLRVQVGADGLPIAVHLEKSSNFPRLDEAARQGVERWRFVPARQGEQAVEASVIVPVLFRLED